MRSVPGPRSSTETPAPAVEGVTAVLAAPDLSVDGTGGPGRAAGEWWAWVDVKRWAVLGLFGLMIVFFTIAEPETFPTWATVRTVLNQAPITLLFALAVTLALLLGEFDISFPYVADLASVIVVWLTFVVGWGSGLGVVGALGVAVAVALVFGLLNGVLIARVHVPAFVATLATSSAAAGAELMTQARLPGGITQVSTTSLPSGIGTVGRATVFGTGLYWSVVMTAVIAGLVWFVLRKTVTGRRIHAIGANMRAAELVGIPVARIRTGVFVAVAGLGGLAGLVLVSRTGYISGSSPPQLLPSYTAAFLGSAVWGLRRFNVVGTVVAVLFLQTLANGLSLMGQPRWIVSVVSGAVLLVAVVLGRARAR